MPAVAAMNEESIPVWGGNFSPLRLVMREEDEWSVTIDEVNSMSYSSTRLFRTSLNVDVGIAPLSMIVVFDGTLVLPRYSEMPKTRALEIFNGHLMDLILGGLYCQAIRPDDVTLGSMNKWGYHRHHCPTGRYGRLSHSLRNRRADPDEAIRLVDPQCLSADEYLTFWSSGRSVASELPSNLSTVFLPACSAYCREEWEHALILGWSSAELIITQFWQQRIQGRAKVRGIKQKRRKDFLSDTRTWTSSARIELLWRLGSINDNLYCLLDQARSARNSFVHSARRCSPDVSRAALQATLHLISAAASTASVSFDAESLMKTLDEHTTPFRTPVADEKGRLVNEPRFWRYPDPAPGFSDWGDRPFEKIPEIRMMELPDRDAHND